LPEPRRAPSFTTPSQINGFSLAAKNSKNNYTELNQVGAKLLGLHTGNYSSEVCFIHLYTDICNKSVFGYPQNAV
jgi:hypothetical protein